MTKTTKQIHTEDITAIRGPEVKSPKQLTVGRWYVVALSFGGLPVHAKLTKVTPDGLGFTFETCASDISDLNVTDIIKREFDPESKRFTTRAGHPFPVYKFKTHPDKLTVAVPAVRKLVPMADKPYPDIPVGTLFEVLPDSGRHVAGSVYQLKENDGSSCPYFKLVSGKGPDDGDDPTHICCSWHRLAKIEEAEPEAAPESVLHEVDQIKSEIDALMANAAAKRDEANGLALAAGKMETEAEALRQKLADSLSGYLPKKPIPFRSF